MPSERAPKLGGPASIFGALALFIGLLAGAECHLRSSGYQTSIRQNPDLWASQRLRVYSSRGIKPLIIAGASRISAAFDPTLFERHYPNHRAVMLAVPAKSPLATLHHLAEDPSFSGLVIVSIAPDHLEKIRAKEQLPLVNNYDQMTSNYGYLNRDWNARLIAWFDHFFVYRAVSFKRKDWLWAVLTGSSYPKQNYIRAFPDYSRALDYDAINAKKSYRRRLERTRKRFRKRKDTPKRHRRWMKNLKQAVRDSKKIRQRGGRVIFLRMVNEGKYYDLFKKRYPRERYWKELEKRVGEDAIHFEDVPTLANFHCPDGSHIDDDDRGRFTLELAKVLEERGLLDPDYQSTRNPTHGTIGSPPTDARSR